MVYSSCLENNQAGNGLVGSNPTSSARKSRHIVDSFHFSYNFYMWRGVRVVDGARLDSV